MNQPSTDVPQTWREKLENGAAVSLRAKRKDDAGPEREFAARLATEGRRVRLVCKSIRRTAVTSGHHARAPHRESHVDPQTIHAWNGAGNGRTNPLGQCIDG